MFQIAPIAALIAAASAGQIYSGQSAEKYAQSAEQYQSALEYQQRGLYSDHSQAPQSFSHEAVHSSRPAGEKTARILGFDVENNGHEYKYSYETENGEFVVDFVVNLQSLILLLYFFYFITS